MSRTRVAIATDGFKGLEDKVSSFFGAAKTFTIIELEGKQIKNVKTVANPAASYTYGRGRTVAQMFVNMKVDTVVASEFGPGASVILEQNRIGKTVAKVGKKVIDVVKEKLLTPS